MRTKIYALCGLLSASMTVMTAQDVVNGGFETWKETAGSSYAPSNGELTPAQRPGIEPEGWNGSSVNQMGVTKELVTKGGDENDAHVVITSDFVGLDLGFTKIGSNAPGYLTFGNPWVFADISNISNSDGGTFGGMEYGLKPDALTLSFKRTFGEEDTEKAEKAHIIAYLWNGTFTSTISGNTEVQDADRAVLGMSEATGDGKLIASVDYEINGEYTNWQSATIPLEYVEANIDETPTKMNIVLSSADYWTRGNIKAGNVLEVDDVHYLFYSKLTDIKVGGTSITGFDSDTYAYKMQGYDLPSADEIEAMTVSPFATTEVTVDEANAAINIVVTNQGGTDTDGRQSHTYTLLYNPTVATQDLFNGSFEAWDEAAGYSFTSSNGALVPALRPGTEPTGWQGSSVNQFELVKEELVTRGGDENNAYAVMTNTYVGMLGMGSNAPAYLTYGDPWLYISIFDIASCDGGTFGGAAYGYRPDALALSYRRTFGEEDTEKAEKAHVIAYLWNGTFTSTIAGETEVNDADRAVLGMTESTGDGKLIASVDYEIAGEQTEWQEVVIPLQYVEENAGEVPTKMNVILSSADYWSRPDIKAGNVLEADDVRFVFNSRLEGIEIDGEALDGFDSDTYEYTINGTLPSMEDVEAVAMSQFASIDITTDEAEGTFIITVGNQGGADVDGETAHTYVLTFDGGNGVASAEASDAKVTAHDGAIHVTAPETVAVEVTDLAGRTVLVTEVNAGTTALDVPTGFYVVRTGAQAVKVLVD